jgi:FKBP-type peptidyl-prolyl cis-trans isomerase 2
MLTFASLVLFITACASGSDDASDETTALVIEVGDVVEVHYVLTIDDGSTVDSSRESGVPLTFTVGDGRVLPGFDRAVRGKRVGDVNVVRIEPADGYGVWDPAKIVEVEIAPSQSDVKVGDEVFLPQRGVVTEIDGGVAKVDVNHELVDEALTFEIEILAVTRA